MTHYRRHRTSDPIMDEYADAAIGVGAIVSVEPYGYARACFITAGIEDEKNCIDLSGNPRPQHEECEKVAVYPIEGAALGAGNGDNDATD